MRPQRTTVQKELFEPDNPVLPNTGQQREHLISLISALILEVMRTPA